MVRNIVTFGFLLLLGLVIQATLVHSLFPSVIAPDFVLILVFYLGLHYKSPRGAVSAFTLGLLSDFASARFIGPTAAGMVVAFYFVTMMSGHMFAEKGYIAGTLAFFASIVKSLVLVAMLVVYAGVDVGQHEILVMLFEAVITGLMTPVLMSFVAPRRGTRRVRHLENEAFR